MDLAMVMFAIAVTTIAVVHAYLHMTRVCVCGHSEIDHYGKVHTDDGRKLHNVCMEAGCTCGRFRRA